MDTQVIGDCAIRRCESYQRLRADAADAGTLSFRSGTRTVTANGGCGSYVNCNHYMDYNSGITAPFLSPGKPVEIRGSGGLDVPPFLLTIDAPEDPEHVLPRPATPKSPPVVEIHRGEEWTHTWNVFPDTAGTFDIMLRSGVEITCTVPAKAGRVTVAAALTAQLDAASAAWMSNPTKFGGLIVVDSHNEGHARAGDYEIDAALHTHACMGELVVIDPYSLAQHMPR